MKMEFRVGEIYAFRYWIATRDHKGMLFSPHSYSDWPSDEPKQDCRLWLPRSGICAFKSLRAVNEHLSKPSVLLAARAQWPDTLLNDNAAQGNTLGLVTGMVSLWGTVWETPDGYKAQYARVAGLFKLIAFPDFRVWAYGPELENLRKKYLQH